MTAMETWNLSVVRCDSIARIGDILDNIVALMGVITSNEYITRKLKGTGNSAQCEVKVILLRNKPYRFTTLIWQYSSLISG